MHVIHASPCTYAQHTPIHSTRVLNLLSQSLRSHSCRQRGVTRATLPPFLSFRPIPTPILARSSLETPWYAACRRNSSSSSSLWPEENFRGLGVKFFQNLSPPLHSRRHAPAPGSTCRLDPGDPARVCVCVCVFVYVCVYVSVRDSVC